MVDFPRKNISPDPLHHTGSDFDTLAKMTKRDEFNAINLHLCDRPKSASERTRPSKTADEPSAAATRREDDTPPMMTSSMRSQESSASVFEKS